MSLLEPFPNNRILSTNLTPYISYNLDPFEGACALSFDKGCDESFSDN